MTRTKKQSTEAAVREIRRRTRRKFAPEEKIRIVLEGLRGEQSISELCRREGIASNGPEHAASQARPYLRSFNSGEMTMKRRWSAEVDKSP
jgi:transposase-like protein